MNRGIKGEKAEEIAARYLKRKGYKIQAQNFVCRMGEIDIIAAQKGVTVFAEVKFRTNTEYARPAEAVNRTKQKKIILTALQYIQKYQIDTSIRFDVLELFPEADKPGKIRVVHIENAFTSEAIPNAYL